MTHSIETSGWDNDPSQGYLPTFLGKLLGQFSGTHAQERDTIGLEREPLDTQASRTLTVNIGAYEGAYRRGKIMNCTQKVDRDMLQ